MGVHSETILALKTKNMFGFISELASATIKSASTPIAMAKDVVNIATGNEADETKKLLDSAINDLEKAADKATGCD